MATEAKNCILKSGKLVPLRMPEQITRNRVMFENGLTRISDARSLYPWKFTRADGSVDVVFLAFPGEVYFAKSNIADDVYDRVFVTGETGFSYTDEDNEKHDNCPVVYIHDRASDSVTRHGIAKTRIAPLRVSVADAGDNTSSPRWLEFVVSWVDSLGYESPISEPSLAKNGSSADATFKRELLECNDGDTIRFESVAVPIDAVAIRVYKNNVGTDGSSPLQFCFELSGASLVDARFGFTYEVSGMDAGEVYPNIQSAPYGLTDVVMMDHGFYAGRVNSTPHTVYFSEIDNPTSWPVDYWLDVGDNIVRIAVVASTVYVLTDGNPYVISGTSPDSMTVARVGTAAACVSKNGVCVMENRLYFVSNRGVYVMGPDDAAGTVCKCVTEQFFTKEQWQELNPSSALLYGHDGSLFMFFTKADGKTHAGYIWDLADGTPVMTQHDEYATCMCTDDRTDDMYFVRDTKVV